MPTTVAIRIAQITNAGAARTVVKYGKQPNKNGPSKKGFSVVVADQSVSPGWDMGGDTLTVETLGRGRSSWMLSSYYSDAEAQSKLGVYVAVDGGDYREVGAMSVLADPASTVSVNIWAWNDDIVIGDGKNRLAVTVDGGCSPFPFFLATWDKISGSDSNPIVSSAPLPPPPSLLPPPTLPPSNPDNGSHVHDEL